MYVGMCHLPPSNDAIMNIHGYHLASGQFHVPDDKGKQSIQEEEQWQ